MRKRTLAVLLSAAMIACSITGCGGNGGKETEGPTAQQEEAAGKKTENKEAEAAKTEAGGDGGITGKTEFANDKLLNLDLSIIQGYEESAKNVTGIDVTIVTSPDVLIKHRFSKVFMIRVHRGYLPGGAAISCRLW